MMADDEEPTIMRLGHGGGTSLGLSLVGSRHIWHDWGWLGIGAQPGTDKHSSGSGRENRSSRSSDGWAGVASTWARVAGGGTP
ncbi:hypothetical protein NL676_001602 [Syzygium grande]|nr:hypothetical protein NL676_001602 [Syzygium grande]